MTYFKNELQFQTALISRLKKPNIYIRNIPDIGNVKKPFDIYGVYKGKGFAIELKYCKLKKKPTPEQTLKQLYPHQVINLINFTKCQGVGYVINYYGCEDKVIYYHVTDEGGTIKLVEIGDAYRDSDRVEKIFSLDFS